MPAEALPLLELFTQLREEGLPLGIGEYQLVLKAWQAGYGQQDRAALARLCRTVWVKSPEEEQIFAVQFARWVPQSSAHQRAHAQSPVAPVKFWKPQALALTVFAASSVVIGGCLLLLQKKASAEFRQLSALSPLVNESSVTLYRASLPIIETAPEDQPETTPGSEGGAEGDIAETDDQVVDPLEAGTAEDSPAELADEIEVSIEEQEDIATVIQTEELLPKPWWQRYGLTMWISLWFASAATWGWLQWRASGSKHQTPQPRSAMAMTMTQQMQDEVQVARLGQTMTSRDYLPVTRRQMKQSWRYLRRMVRSGPATELDMDATVQDIGRRGLLLAPVFRARRVNRAEVLLLIDYDGSMVPFHGLSQRLVETALQGGRLTQARVYYFHNCPVGWLYHDPYQQTAESIEQMLHQLTSDYAGVLIVSDGGAAYGRWSPERLRLTEQFLDQVAQQVRYFAWLNPMPASRWAGTTAGAIAQQVPMFEFDRAGLEAAISVLRGQRGRHL